MISCTVIHKTNWNKKKRHKMQIFAIDRSVFSYAQQGHVKRIGKKWMSVHGDICWESGPTAWPSQPVQARSWIKPWPRPDRQLPFQQLGQLQPSQPARHHIIHRSIHPVGAGQRRVCMSTNDDSCSQISDDRVWSICVPFDWQLINVQRATCYVQRATRNVPTVQLWCSHAVGQRFWRHPFSHVTSR